MRWIILALTLGASVTSIIHGVFMLFGTLSSTAGAVLGIPETLSASLPLISAILALAGGIIAFNYSKWGALFLVCAAAVCAPASRDIWFYGGIYFLAGILCFFLKKPYDIQDSYYYDEEEDENYTEDEENNFEDEYYPEQDEEENINNEIENNKKSRKNNIYDDIPDELEADIKPENLNLNEQPKVRRRTSKICPTCGATVENTQENINNSGVNSILSGQNMNLNSNSNQNDEIDEITEIPNNKLNINVKKVSDPVMENYDDLNFNGGEDMSANDYRVTVQRPERDNTAFARSNVNPGSASSTYQSFSNSRYTRRGKKPKKSLGRKILGVFLLIAAVGGALYFLLGLRKLPPGELPPMVRPEITNADERNNNNIVANAPTTRTRENSSSRNTQTVEAVSVNKNILPNFTPETEPRQGVISGNAVNVRAEHSTNSQAVTKLNNNARVEILDSWTGRSGNLNGTWYKINTNGREGWVFGKYLRPSGSGLPSGYSNALLKSLGSSRSELIESLGQPVRGTSTNIEWSGLSVNLRGDEITRLSITGSRYELQNGVKVGMSRENLTRIMGYPSSINSAQRLVNYNEGSKTGLSVRLSSMNDNATISAITVNEVR